MPPQDSLRCGGSQAASEVTRASLLPFVRRPAQICDTVSELGVELVDEAAPGGTHWPELLPAMFACVQSGVPILVECGLTVLGSVAAYMIDTLRPQLPAVVSGLAACLGHANADVQLAALNATAQFIQVRRLGGGKNSRGRPRHAGGSTRSGARGGFGRCSAAVRSRPAAGAGVLMPRLVVFVRAACVAGGGGPPGARALCAAAAAHDGVPGRHAQRRRRGLGAGGAGHVHRG